MNATQERPRTSYKEHRSNSEEERGKRVSEMPDISNDVIKAPLYSAAIEICLTLSRISAPKKNIYKKIK
jgi:phage terminase small subunit